MESSSQAIMPSIVLNSIHSLQRPTSHLVQAFPKPINDTRVKSVATVDSASKRTSTPKTISSHSGLDRLSYHLHTICLFIYSDVKTVVLPWALFGIAHALSTSVFGMKTSKSTLAILTHLPRSITWIVLNLLPFAIGNQRHPTAILEDSINKAWRPLPSKRISPSNAGNLMIAAYLVAFIYSLIHGAAAQCVFLAILGYIHNDLGGGDKSWIVRNLLNGLGFVSFGSGAMEVALGHQVAYSPALIQWLRVIVLVVFTSVQTQDMYDQAGDAMVKRSTLPLIIGDQAARWTIVCSVLAWSVFCPWYSQTGVAGYSLCLWGAAMISRRTLTKKSVEQDRKTFKIWNLWLVVVYCLPLLKLAKLTWC